MKDIWILVEIKSGEVDPVTLELATLGRTLAKQTKEEVCGVMFDIGDRKIISQLEEYGIDKLYIIGDERLKNYSYDLHSDILKGLMSEAKPRIFFSGNTFMGNEFARRMAARLKVGLVTNCTKLKIIDNEIYATSLIWQGKLERNMRCNSKEIAVITVIQDVVEAKPQKPRKGIEIITVESETTCKGIPQIIGSETLKPEDIDLKEAEIIITVGKGVGRRNLHLIEELGNLLGGSIGASRAVVDEGWLPYSRQIGQTGKAVTPKLYIACGVSGQIYHAIGMKESKYIIVMNKDRNAPFFNMADIGLVGDFKEIASAIISKLKK